MAWRQVHLFSPVAELVLEGTRCGVLYYGLYL